MNNLAQVTLDYNRGTEYLQRNNIKKAMQLLKKALSIYSFKEGYTNLGNCHRALGEDKRMIECYKNALDDKIPFLDPTTRTDLHAMNNLGLSYFMYGDDDRAIDMYRRVISRQEDFFEARWNLSTALLRKACSGHPELFKEGWQEYNCRFKKKPPVELKNTREKLPFWDGISGGEGIVLLAEQGMGDAIMFGRYFSLLQSKFSKVYIQCSSEMEHIFRDFECVRDPITIVCDDLVAYPICSIAGCFDEIPSGEWLRGKYGKKEFEAGFNVGIVWDGSSTHANNRYRSTSIGRFTRLAKYCNLYSLSPGRVVNKHVKSLNLKTWTDTAEAINGLDLIISVDTSVVHLAGSLGARVWMLQPYKETDFRWGNGIRRSVWYDSVEIYENPQDWEYVFDCVERDLRELVYA